MNINLIKTYAPFIGLIILGTACSMKDRASVYGISVQLPPSAQKNLMEANVFRQANSSFGAPTGISGMQCFALNITGSGLSADQRFGCTHANQNMGLMAGMAPIAGGTVDALVPAGPARLIQLIGVQSSVGCPSFDSLLNALNPNDSTSGGLDGVGEPYLLGSTTVDVFADTTVNIHAVFDPNQKLFQGCGNSAPVVAATPSQQLTIGLINNSPIVQNAYCTPISINAVASGSGTGSGTATGTSTATSTGTSTITNVNPTISSALPTVIPVATNVAGSGTVNFYSDSNCTTSLVLEANGNPTPLAFASNQKTIGLYMIVPASLNTLTLQAQSADATWATPPVTINTTRNRLFIEPITTAMIATPAANTAANCTPLYFDLELDGSISNASNANRNNLNLAEHYDFWVSNTVLATTPSTQFFYAATDCSANTNPIPAVATGTTGQNVHYDISYAAPSTSLWVRDSIPEKVQISISSKINAAVPSAPALSYVGFNNPQLNLLASDTHLFESATTIPNIAVDAAGNIYYPEFGTAGQTAGQIMKFSPQGAAPVAYPITNQTAFNGSSNMNGEIFNPYQITIDSAGNLYVASRRPNNYGTRIIKITTATNITPAAGTATAILNMASVSSIQGMAVDASGNLYCSTLDSAGNPTQLINVYTSSNTFSTFGADILNNPQSLTADGTGNIYTVDIGNHVIRKSSASNNNVLTLFAGTSGNQWGVNSSSFNFSPTGFITSTTSGTLFAADIAGATGYIRKITNSPVLSPYCGNGSTSTINTVGDCTQTGIMINGGMTVGADQSLYFINGTNIYKVSP